MRPISLTQRILGVVAVCLICIGFSFAMGVQWEKRGPIVYGSPIHHLWLGQLDQDPDPPPDGSIYVYFIQSTYPTGLKAMNSSGTINTLPFVTSYANQFPVAYSIPIFDSNTNIAASLGDDHLTPLYATPIANAKALSMPGGFGVADALDGQVLYAESVADETAPDTSTVKRAYLAFGTVPIKVAEVASVDLNVTTKTTLFTPISGQTWVVDYCIVRNASTSLTTAQFPFGSNANADDWLATDLYDELTTATKFTKVYPMVGAEVTTDTTPFGVKPTVAQGAAATVTIEVYAHRVS